MYRLSNVHSLTGKNVVVLGNLPQHIQRFADANREKLDFRLCKAMGSDTDIVVAADYADTAEVKRAKKQGLRILDDIDWFNAVDEALGKLTCAELP